MRCVWVYVWECVFILLSYLGKYSDYSFINVQYSHHLQPKWAPAIVEKTVDGVCPYWYIRLTSTIINSSLKALSNQKISDQCGEWLISCSAGTAKLMMLWTNKLDTVYSTVKLRLQTTTVRHQEIQDLRETVRWRKTEKLKQIREKQCWD